MTENLAANNEGFANPDEAANEQIGGNASAPLSAEPAAPEQALGGKDLTRLVARRIKEERQKARQDLVTEIFGSAEACAAYQEQQEQIQLNQQDLTESAFLAELALASDPELGEHYLQLADQVKELSEQYQVDLESAFLVTLGQQLPELLAAERLQSEQQLLQKLAANAATPGSLQDAMPNNGGILALSDQEFTALVERVKMGKSG